MRKLFLSLCLTLVCAFANATTLTTPSMVTVSLAAGKQLTVTTSAASTALVQRYNGTAFIAQTPIAASTTVVFGEYFIEEDIRISNFTGTLTYAESQSTAPVLASTSPIVLTSGTIDGVAIGGSTPAAATFTTATATTFVGALTGNASTSTSATTAGTVTTAAQSAITSVGTLTSLTTSGHIVAGGLPAVGACGTTPSILGADNGMTVTVGTGDTDTDCAVTFGAVWANAPSCIAQSDTDITALKIVTTTSTVTVSKTAAFTAGSKLHIQCMGF